MGNYNCKKKSTLNEKLVIKDHRDNITYMYDTFLYQNNLDYNNKIKDNNKIKENNDNNKIKRIMIIIK